MAVVAPDYETNLRLLLDAGFELRAGSNAWDAPRAFVRDPGGNLVEVMSKPPLPPFPPRRGRRAGAACRARVAFTVTVTFRLPYCAVAVQTAGTRRGMSPQGAPAQTGARPPRAKARPGRRVRPRRA